MGRTVADLVGSAEGADVFVIGGGPSLKGFDFSRLNHDKAIAIALNGTIAIAGFDPLYHFWCDGLVAVKWPVYAPHTTCVYPDKADCFIRMVDSAYKELISYDQVMPEVKDIKDWVSSEYDFRWPWPMSRIKFPDHAMSLDGNDIFCYNTCATGAIHLAGKMGARRIFLLGLDAYGLSTGESYCNGEHSAVDDARAEDIGGGRIRTPAHMFWDMEQAKAREYWEREGRYQERYPGEGIFNLSRNSTLTTWEKVDRETALKESLELVGV